MLTPLLIQPPRAVLARFALVLFVLTFPAFAFEGRINVSLNEGGQTNALLYTVGPEHLRIEMTATNWPNPIDIVERQSGGLTLVYPHNRSFVRVKPVVDNASAGIPGMPTPPGGLPAGIGPQSGAAPWAPGMPTMPSMPALPPGVGPQAQTAPAMPPSSAIPNMSAPPGMPPMPNMPPLPQGVGPQAQAVTGSGVPVMPSASSIPNMPTASGMPSMPQMPAASQMAGGLPPGTGPRQGGAIAGAGGMPAMSRMPMPPMMMNQKLELTATGQKTNLLGFTCEEYQLKQRGEHWTSGRRTSCSRTSRMCKTNRTDSARNK
jgi:hypothetical protein